MRLRAFLEGLVSYQGTQDDFGGKESDAMKAHRQSVGRDSRNFGGFVRGDAGDKAQGYADKMSVEQMQDEIKDAKDMLDASETTDQVNRYKEKIKALQAAIKIKKQREKE